MTDRLLRLWPWALAGYFLLQFLLRVGLGGALETDEAEMVLLTPGWQPGYGPQLPLYSWLQMGAFTVLGRSVVALAALKNLMLLATFLFLWAGLRRMLPPALALGGTLSLFLVPDVFWEGQRATTHSVALMMMVSATIWAVARVLDRPDRANHLVLGVVLGLGGLSKFNYWLVPVSLALALATLPTLRERLSGRGLALSAAVAALILAGPVAWMLRHPELAFASSYKLANKEVLAGLPWLGVLAGTAVALASGLGLLALAVLALRRWGGAGDMAAGETGRAFLVLLARAAAIAAGLFLAGMLLGGATGVTSRWMLPVFQLAAPPAVALVLARGSARGLGLLAGLAAGLAGLTLAGMVVSRHLGEARGAVDFAALEAALAPLDPAGRPILADFYLGGNLAYRHPDWTVRPFLPVAPPPPPGTEVLVLTRDRASALGGLRKAGWPEAAMEVAGQLEIAVPYARSSGHLAVTATVVQRVAE